MDNFSRGLLSLAGNGAETSITVSLTKLSDMNTLVGSL